MMRNDINIAIVVMVKVNTTTTTNTSTISNITAQSINDDAEFDWSSTVTSMILGTFYLCYVLAQVSIISINTFISFR